MQVGIEMPQPSGSKEDEGVFSRVMDWLAGTHPRSSGADQPAASSSSGAAGEAGFLLPSDDPDKRLQRARAQQQRAACATPEEEWRRDCLAFAEVKDLRAVEEARLFYFDPGSVGREDDAEVTLVGIGAHYRRQLAPQEDLLLHVVKEMELVGPSRPYSIVYFNAEASLGAFPDTIFFQQLHAALHPAHKRNLQAFYIVHPTRLLKAWVFMLRLAIPEVYGRVTYCERLAQLHALLGPESALEIPQHVEDHDRSLG